MNNKYLVTTEDGTSTLFLQDYDQAMHSMSGAYDESLLKHVFPSRILDRDSGELNALDIGFGLGYNVLALMNEFLNKNNKLTLNIISLEKDKNFLEFMKRIEFNDSRDNIYNFIKEVYVSGKGNYYGINLQIIIGDARETLRKLQGMRFDAIFQDPFSPSKNPELWSVNYFLKLKELLQPDGIITTYSSADQIRRAMTEAGLNIGRGPSVGKKREGTIASLIETETELSDEDKMLIFNNVKSEPYEDPYLNFSRETILDNRLIKIKKLKNEPK